MGGARGLSAVGGLSLILRLGNGENQWQQGPSARPPQTKSFYSAAKKPYQLLAYTVMLSLTHLLTPFCPMTFTYLVTQRLLSIGWVEDTVQPAYSGG